MKPRATKRDTKPPALAVALLEGLLEPGIVREDILGNLHEEFTERAAGRSPRIAAVWYWRQAVSIGLRVLGTRRRRRRGRAEKRRMGTLYQDIRFAVRSLRRSPGFALLVIMTLAIGIGANTAIFSLVNTLLFQPLPFEEPGRLVRMRDAVARPGEQPWLYNTSTRSFVLLERQAEVFDGIVAQRHRIFNVTGRGDPTRVTGIGVSASWLAVLGVAPVLGRGFSEEDERAGSDSRAVVLGYGMWQRAFGGDSAAVGQSITLDALQYTVIGVMPRRFNFPYGAQLWVPATFERDGPNFDPHVTARIKQGLTLAQAQVGLNDLSRRMATEFPDTHASVTFTAVPLRDDLVDNHPRLGWILLGAVGFLLLVGCANIANLLLVRSISRRKEFATRSVAGASRRRIVTQLVVESLTLVVVATGLGLVLTTVMTNVLATLSVSATSSLGEFFQYIRIDRRVLTFTALVALGTALVFGVIPAFKASRVDLHQLLKPGSGVEGPAGSQALGILVAAEVALALILLNGAGLMVQSFVTLQGREVGYDPTNRLAINLAMPLHKYSDIEARLQFVERVIERVVAVRGVMSAGVTQHLPLSPGSETQRFSVEGGPASEPGRELLTNLRIVSPDYHATMGISLLQGRFFSEEEGRGRTPPVVIVSEPMAARFWSGDDPIGKRVKFGSLDSRGPWRTVVGVVGDVDERFAVEETWYLPYGHAPVRDLILVVRTAPDPDLVVNTIREAIWEIDPDLPVEDVQSMEQVVVASRSGDRVATFLMGVFAAFAALMAALGIYAVVSFAVTRQIHDIGIRMALGSSQWQVLSLVLRRGAAPVGVGMLVGVPASVMLTRTISSILARGGANIPLELGMVRQVSMLQPVTYLAIAGVLAIVGLAGCYLPARRATVVDPATVLRYE